MGSRRAILYGFNNCRVLAGHDDRMDWRATLMPRSKSQHVDTRDMQSPSHARYPSLRETPREAFIARRGNSSQQNQAGESIIQSVAEPSEEQAIRICQVLLVVPQLEFTLDISFFSAGIGGRLLQRPRPQQPARLLPLKANHGSARLFHDDLSRASVPLAVTERQDGRTEDALLQRTWRSASRGGSGSRWSGMRFMYKAGHGIYFLGSSWVIYPHVCNVFGAVLRYL